jgi:thymidine kinase
VIADEVQFYAPTQIDQLAQAVDDLGVDVDCFGITTDFSSRLFPGAQRLLEIADECLPLQVRVLCHCGQPGQQNARVVAGQVVHTGEQVVVGDVTGSDVSYRVLCRKHWRLRQAGPR